MAEGKFLQNPFQLAEGKSLAFVNMKVIASICLTLTRSHGHPLLLYSRQVPARTPRVVDFYNLRGKKASERKTPRESGTPRMRIRQVKLEGIKPVRCRGNILFKCFFLRRRRNFKCTLAVQKKKQSVFWQQSM
jgi:hypothetical protein